MGKIRNFAGEERFANEFKRGEKKYRPLKTRKNKQKQKGN